MGHARRSAVWGVVIVAWLVTPTAARGQDHPDDASAVAAVVEAWVAAQDAGNLPAYEALLAPDFASNAGPEGRGPTGRAGWLAAVHDRFEERTRVESALGGLARGPGLALARVHLSRGPGASRDESDTWLWLAATPEGWRVAGAEEQRLRARPRAAAAPGPAVALVVHAGAPYLVLRAARPADLPADRVAGLVEAEAGWLAWPLDDVEVGADDRRWAGRAVVLHDAAGPACRGVVEGAVLLVRAAGTPPGADQPGLALDLARVWVEAPGGGAAFVAVRLGPSGHDACETATWAHLDDDPPEILARWPVSTDVRGAALRAWRHLPAYRDAARLGAPETSTSARAGRRRRGRWELAPGARVEVRGFGPATDGARYVALSASAPGAPCPGASALWQVFDHDARRPHLVLLSGGGAPARAFLPDVVLRHPALRDPAFLDATRLVLPAGRRPDLRLDVSPPLYATTPRGGSTTSTPWATVGARPSSTRPVAAAERAHHARAPRSP